MTKTPGAPDASGGRPPGQPPTPQRLFPSATKAGARVASVDSVGGSIDEVSLDLALSVLGTTYDEQEVRERLSSTFVHGVHALQRARSAGWYTTYEFEEELLKLFTQSAAAAALTSTTPSPADRTSGDLGAQVATATAKDTRFPRAPSPTSPRHVLGAQVPMEDTICRPLLPDGLTEAMEAMAAPQIPANLVQFPGGPVPTVPQPTPQAARTSMDAASPDSVAASADRAQGQSGTSKCPTFAYRKPKTIEANPTCRLQPPDGKTDPRDAQSPPDQPREDISMPPPLRLPSPESLDVAALHITPPLNPASCKTRGNSVCMGATTLDLISASEDRGECRNPLPIPSSHPQSAAVASLHITPPLNPAPCTTREPSVDVEATAPDLTSNPPDENEMLADMLQAEEEENEEEEIHHGMQAEDEEDEGVQDEEEMLQQLITQCHNWECTEGHSAVFLIATMLADTFPPGRTSRHYQVARQLRQFPSNPWEDYRDTVPVQAFLEATRARASRSFAGGGTRRWLTASNLELPERLVDDVARRSAPLPEEMLRPH